MDTRLAILAVIVAAAAAYFGGASTGAGRKELTYVVRFEGAALPSPSDQESLLRMAAASARVDSMELGAERHGSRSPRLTILATPARAAEAVEAFIEGVQRRVVEYPIDETERSAQLHRVETQLADILHVDGEIYESVAARHLHAQRESLLVSERPAWLHSTELVAERDLPAAANRRTAAVVVLAVLLGPACWLIVWRPRPTTIAGVVDATAVAGMPAELSCPEGRRAA